MQKYLYRLTISLLCFFCMASLAGKDQSKSLIKDSPPSEKPAIYNLMLQQEVSHNFLNSHSKVKQTKAVGKN